MVKPWLTHMKPPCLFLQPPFCRRTTAPSAALPGASTRVPEVPGAPDDVGAVPGVGEKEDFNP